MQLRWNSEPGIDVTSRAQLDQVLDALLSGPATAQPLIAHLVGDAGALGLGLDPAGNGLLLFAPADRSHPALHGVGQPPPGDDDLVFSAGQRPYQFSSHCQIPAPTVRAAAQQYLATRQLPTCVIWEPEPTSPLHQAQA